VLEEQDNLLFRSVDGILTFDAIIVALFFFYAILSFSSTSVVIEGRKYNG
jgi:hypothetical protein